MARVLSGERTFLTPVLGWVGAPHLPRGRRRSRQSEMPWTEYAVAALLFNFAGFLAVYALQRFQDVLPLNPGGARRGVARFLLQHRGELRHQHQLAGLRRRVDDELPHADARARRAELRLRRDGHRGAGGAHPRLRAQVDCHDRQLLGRPDALAPSTSCCRCPWSSPLALVGQGVVQTFGPTRRRRWSRRSSTSPEGAATARRYRTSP